MLKRAWRFISQHLAHNYMYELGNRLKGDKDHLGL